VEIPRELAKYMHGLQSRIAALEEENERLKKGTR